MDSVEFPVETTRRVGKEKTLKKLGKQPSAYLAKLATEYIQNLVEQTDIYVTEQGRNRITPDDIKFVKNNFKGF